MLHCKFDINVHTKAVTGLKYCSNGSWLASCSADQTCKIFDTKTGRKVADFEGKHTEGINDIVWLNAGSRGLATASDDSKIVVWDTERENFISELNGHESVVYCLSNHPVDNILISGSQDCTWKMWDLRSGTKCVYNVDAHSEPLTSIHFHPSGIDVMTTGYDGVIRLWDTRNGACLRTIVHEKQTPIGYGRYSPNGLYVVTSGLDSVIRMIRPYAGTVYPTDKPPGVMCSGRSSRASNTFRCVMGTVKDIKRYHGHSSERYCSPIALARLGQMAIDDGEGKGNEQQSKHEMDVVISGSEDATIHIWDTNSQRPKSTITGHRGPILALDYNAVDQQLATGGGSGDFGIKLWGYID